MARLQSSGRGTVVPCHGPYTEAPDLLMAPGRYFRSWPIATDIVLEPNVGFRGTAEVAGAFQDRKNDLRVS